MAPPLKLPQQNQLAHSFVGFELRYGSNIYTGIKSCRYGHKVEPGGGHGTLAVQIIATSGLYTANAEIEFYLYEYDRLITDLGDFYMEKFLNGTATWRAPRAKIITDRLQNMRMLESNTEGSEGGDPTTKKVPFFVGGILESGKRPISNMGY